MARNGMALTSGTKLGPYEIQSPLGAGGMGEVYRARDTRLERTVAVKVLPSHLSGNPEAKQRFDREARAISSLNHPNICTVHDVGHQDGVDFLVMEFLDGQTLAHRLARGSLRMDEVLKYGMEMCEGLEKAHGRGVIHRDLKPGNIMLTKTAVKLMDFGLAKAMSPARSKSSGLTETVSLSDIDHPLTAEGTIVGTFQYMSPEQVEGKEADPRSDIFALGVVLYEMATGDRAFNGKTTAAVMAAILERNPEPISRSQPAFPPALDRAIRLCLAKDPDDRWQTVHDLKLELEGIGQNLGATAASNQLVGSWRTHAGRVSAFTAVLLLLTAAGLRFLLSRGRSKVPHAPAVRALLLPPKDFSFAPYRFALSPDGRKIAFVATSDSKPKGILWMQQLDSMTAQSLAGTEDVADSGYPFWSPDSTKIGFFSEGKLKRVDANGGVVTTLADTYDSHGGSWSQDGFIVFSKSASENELLYRVPASGGDVDQITTADKHHLGDVHRWPSFLPDGRHILLSCSWIEEWPKPDVSGVRISHSGCIVDSASKERLAVQYGDPGQYVNGLLLYVEDGNLTAGPFDPSNKTLGARWPVAEQIARDEILRTDAFSASPAGVLAYMSEQRALSQLVWRTRLGQVIETVEPAGTYDGIALSPDEQRVATSRSDSPDARYLWMQDVGRGSASRFSDKVGQNRQAVWSRDGSKVANASTVPSGGIYGMSSTGRGQDYELFKDLSPGTANVPTDFSPDGRLLLYINFAGETGSRLWIHPLVGGQKDYALLKSDSPEGEAQFSPDGRWLAYVSEETGRPEVDVVTFPGLSSVTQVSILGGNQPRWRRDGKELFFIAPDSKMVAVPLKARGNILEAGTPHALFQTQITAVAHAFYQYDVTADGQKFIVNTRIEQAPRLITIYVNWDAEVKR